jgi:DNA-binding winged helix-turn-helix (wHTH) protein
VLGARASSEPIRFGPFEVDPNAGELRKQGVKIKLQEQPLQILRVLLERPGEVVAREELQQCLWPSDTFVDFDHGLYNAIKRLREALGDTADTPRFIETVPKRGYRFIAPLNGLHHAPIHQTDTLPISVRMVDGSGARHRPWKIGIGAAVGMLLLAAGAVGLNVGGLRYHLFGRQAPASGNAFVSEKIDQGKFDKEEPSPPKHNAPTNPKALDDLLKGSSHANTAYEMVIDKSGSMKESEKEFTKGFFYLERAIKEDPNYVPSYVALAGAIMGEPPHCALTEKARDALDKALALDESNADVHLLMAEYLGCGYNTWDKPDYHYKRAIQLRPDSAEVHEAFAEYMDDVGRLQEGMKEHQRAQQLDPDADYLGPSPLTPLAVRLERKRTFMIRNNPGDYDYWMRGEMEYESGQYADALKDWAGVARDHGWTAEADAWERAFASGGAQALIREVARSLDEIAKDRWFPRDIIIDAHLYTGDKEATLAWLQTISNEGDRRVLRHLRSDHRWDPYRSDPRFERIIHNAGLAP